MCQAGILFQKLIPANIHHANNRLILSLTQYPTLTKELKEMYSDPNVTNIDIEFVRNHSLRSIQAFYAESIKKNKWYHIYWEPIL